MKKYYTYHAGYFKQGDDLGGLLEVTKTNKEALNLWSKQLLEASQAAARLAELIPNKGVEIDADTHHIGFSGDNPVLEKLAEDGILEKDEFEEDFEDEEE